MNNIYKLYLVSFAANLQLFGAVSIPFFLDWAELNYKSIFLLESFYTCFILLSEIPNGIFADRFSRKKSLFLGLIFLGLGYITFSFSNNFTSLILAEFFCAFGAAFLSGADKALLYELLKKEKLETDARAYFAKMQSFGTLGMALGLPLGSVFATSNFITPYPYSLPLTFLFSSVVSFAVALVILTIDEENREVKSKRFVHKGVQSFLSIYRNKNLLWLCSNLVMINTPTFFIVWLYQPLLGECGIDIKYYGFVACAFNLFSIFLLNYISKIEAYFGTGKLLFFTGIFPGIIFITFTLFNNAYFVIFSIILAFGIKTLRTPIINDYINSHIEDESRATILSTVSMMQRVSLLFINPIVGYFSDISIEYALLFLGILLIIVSTFFQKPHPEIWSTKS